MKQWRLFSVTAVSLLCLLSAVLGWRSFELVRNARFVSRISSELYPQGGIVPDPKALERNLPALERAQAAFPGDIQLADLLFESLLYSAYFNPDEAVEPLRQALPLGREMLEREPSVRVKIASQLGWTLFFADLPNELCNWYDSMNRIERAESGQLTYYVILAQAAQDDVEGALLRLDREMRDERFSSDMEAMAVTLYVGLNEYEKAGQHALIAANHGITSLDYLWGMGRYYVEQDNFEAAHSFFNEHYVSLSRSPDSAYDVALCRAAIYGPNDRELSELLDRAALTVRRETSRSGLEAALCADLLNLRSEAQWYDRLQRLSQSNPDDFFVSAVMAGMACTALERSYGASRLNRHVKPPLPFEFEKPLPLAEHARQLATGPYQQQQAEMMLAYAAAYSVNSALPDEALLSQAVLHLRRALGDEATEGHIVYSDTADYTSFIADRHVRALRSASPKFDLEVNRAIVDFLNRKRSQYEDLLVSPPLEYKDALRLSEHSSTT